MTDAEFVSWLKEVETTLPVATWTVRGIRVWPIIRLNIYALNFGALIAEESLGHGVANNARIALRGIGSWARAAILDNKHSIRVTREADAVFLAYSIGRQPTVESKKYNTLVAPYVKLVSDRRKTSTVWEMSPYGEYNIPRFTSSALIQPRLLALRILSRASISQMPPDGKQLQDYDQLLVRIARAGLAFRYRTLTLLDHDIRFVRELATLFRRWLTRVKPSHGFVADYGLREHAFCLACREMGITTVDIQHGVQGALHPAYGSWFAVPDDGYETKPRVFWCWDQGSADAINAWAQRCPDAHQAVVGGEPWRDRWLSPSADVLVQRTCQQIAELTTTGADRHILITLDSRGELFPPVVLEAMRLAPSSWCFWVRPHPANAHRRIGPVEKLLQQYRLTHAPVATVAELPLFALLRYVSCHITANASSVVLQAEAFGVPSVGSTAMAAAYYPAQIQRGVLSIVSTPTELIEAIRTAERFAASSVVPNGLQTMDQILQIPAHPSRRAKDHHSEPSPHLKLV